MSVLRQFNFLGQARVDVPHLRSVESSICADFDLLAGRMVAGRAPVVVEGFKIAPSGFGVPAETLQLLVADSMLIHYLASESGSIFQVPATASAETLSRTNARVRGNFTPSATNYIGLDLVRAPDVPSSDLVMFLDANSLQEQPKTVPLGRALDFRIYISTAIFSSTPNLIPLAIVTTGPTSTNPVTAIEDARNKIFRLGSGGTTPDRFHSYTWSTPRREQVAGVDPNPFIGGDKALDSMKGWADALMSRIWEIGGGEYWYSQTADRNIKMYRSGATFPGTEHFEWDGTNLHWKGIGFTFENSLTYNNPVANQLTDSPGLTNLADGECLYVNLDRYASTTLTAHKAVLMSLGAGFAGSKPGTVIIMAWRVGANVYTRDGEFAVGASGGVPVATPTILGIVKLSDTAGTPLAPFVAAINAANLAAVNSGISRGVIAGAGTLNVGGAAVDVDIIMGQFATGSVAIGNPTTTNKGINKLYGQGNSVAPTDDIVGAAWATNNTDDRAAGGQHGTSAIHSFDCVDGDIGAGIYINVAYFENSGALVFRVTEPDETYYPVANKLGYCKLFFTTNGEACDVGLRQQLRVMWEDGTETTIAESPVLACPAPPPPEF